MCKCNCACHNDLYEDYVIVRSQAGGVFAGVCKERGTVVTIRHARRLWYWSGAASLSELSQRGVKNPNSCKFPCEVPEVYMTGVIEILPVTAEAQAVIRKVPEWKV